MTSKTRNILLKLCLFILSITCLLFVACGGTRVKIYNAEGTLVFSQDCEQIEIEYGDAYALPQKVQINGKKKNSEFP